MILPGVGAAGDVMGRLRGHGLDRLIGNYPPDNLKREFDFAEFAALNQGLSERRAKTVRDYLIRYGVDPSRVTFRGYGESEPIANNTTVEGRAQNRRVELRITEQ